MPKTIILFLVLATISESLSNDYQYCDKNICKKGPHILCPYTPKYTCTKNVIHHGLSQEEKDIIVNFHNKLRKAVVDGTEKRLPRAANMETMTWDDELARMAQAWVDQCHIGHNKCRNTAKGGYVGQNYVLTPSDYKGTPVQLENQILEWYDEIVDFDLTCLGRPYKLEGCSKNNKVVGHFTQIIWSKTNKVGCGRIIYKNENGFEMYYLVCNYAPGGNFQFAGNVIYPLAEPFSQPNLPSQPQGSSQEKQPLPPRESSKEKQPLPTQPALQPGESNDLERQKRELQREPQRKREAYSPKTDQEYELYLKQWNEEQNQKRQRQLQLRKQQEEERQRQIDEQKAKQEQIQREYEEYLAKYQEEIRQRQQLYEQQKREYEERQKQIYEKRQEQEARKREAVMKQRYEEERRRQEVETQKREEEEKQMYEEERQRQEVEAQKRVAEMKQMYEEERKRQEQEAEKRKAKNKQPLSQWQQHESEQQYVKKEDDAIAKLQKELEDTWKQEDVDYEKRKLQEREEAHKVYKRELARMSG